MSVLEQQQQPAKPIIAVCGGVRGLQGSSVIHYLRRDGIFAARALTRDIECAKAVELTQQGVQVVYANFDDPESLRHAFDGVYGVFGMTNYFDHGAPEREIQQGRNIVDAAKAAGVKHFVWSSLEDEPGIDYFWTKAKVQRYLEESGLPHTNVFLTFFFQNMFLFGMQKQEDGSYELTWPFPTDEEFPSLAPADVGGWVTAAFNDPYDWIGKDIKVCNECLTPRQFAKILHEVAGLEVRVHEQTKEDFYALKDDYDPQAWHLMEWLLTRGRRDRDTKLARKLHGDLKDLRTWIGEYLDIPPQLPSFIAVSINFEIITSTGTPLSTTTRI